MTKLPISWQSWAVWRALLALHILQDFTLFTGPVTLMYLVRCGLRELTSSRVPKPG